MVSAKDCLAKYGDPIPAREGLFMRAWRVPDDLRAAFPCLPTVIYLNKDLLAPLAAALRNLKRYGLAAELRTWDGCFNVRVQRGSKVASLHSWGVAVDLNAAWNALGKVPTLSKAFVACFVDAGFDWGGDWRRPDGMHFQLAHI